MQTGTGTQAGNPPRPRVVVVGGGFGGLHAARSLAHLNVDVTVIDRRNHHLFQPLLYQVALAVLSPADIAQPIRTILREQSNAEVLMDEVVGIDVSQRQVALASGARIAYDYLARGMGPRGPGAQIH
jgi:NADH dehydrogenase